METKDVPEVPTLSMANLREGAAEELFADALALVLKNMQDPNTDWKKPRQIRMTFTFAQDEARKMAAVDVDCTTKMPSVKPVSTVIYVGQDKGKLAAVEAPPQRDFFQTPAGRPQPVAEVVGG